MEFIGEQLLDVRAFAIIILGGYFITERTSIQQHRWVPKSRTYLVLLLGIAVCSVLLLIEYALNALTPGSISQKIVAYLAATSVYEVVLKPVKKMLEDSESAIRAVHAVSAPLSSLLRRQKDVVQDPLHAPDAGLYPDADPSIALPVIRRSRTKKSTRSVRAPYQK